MKRVAVIEDNEDNRLLVQALLQDRYEIDLFPGGAEGLEGMSRNRPDLVLLDISLPGMDGVEVLRLLRDHRSFADIPVIALTAHAMEGDRERLLAIGFDDYVSKPIVDENDLLRSIAGCLARERSS